MAAPVGMIDDFAEYDEIVQNFSILAINALGPSLYEEFGVTDSHKYAEKLLELMPAAETVGRAVEPLRQAHDVPASMGGCKFEGVKDKSICNLYLFQ